MSTIFVDNIKAVSGTDTFTDGQYRGVINASATGTFAGTTTGTHSGASTGAHSGTIASGVALPASHITIGGVQSGMTTRTGSLKWGDSQIGSVTGSAFTIDNTGSFTKIDMAQNALIWIHWMGIGNGTGYWSVNKNSGTAGNTTSSQRVAYSYQTHGQCVYHGYALSTDYFVCVLHGDTMQNSDDICKCSVMALKVA